MGKPTASDIEAAMRIMQQTIDRFPMDPGALAVAASCITDMVSSREQLNWLTHTVCRVMKRYSLPELREIFCTQYPVEEKLAGEAEYYRREAEESARKLEQWKHETKLLGEAPHSFEIPAASYHTMEPPPRKPVTREQPPGRGDARTMAELEGELQQQMEQSQKRSATQSARLVEELEWQLRLAREMEKKLAQG